MEYLYCALIGYFFGVVNPAYLFGRRKGMDIRQNGSKNAGASNALVLLGKATGLLCAALDVAKTVLAILLTGFLFPSFDHALPITGVFCALGHIFPFYMGFRGGKGLACLGGMILAYDWRVLLIMLACEVVVAFVTDYLCFVPITATIAFPVIYYLQTGDNPGSLILIGGAIVILSRHIENLRRIRSGTELHFHYLWHPQEELSRISSNQNDPE